METINIPFGVTEIGENAFNGTPYLANQLQSNDFFIINGILLDISENVSGDVTIPDNVTKIGDEVFEESTWEDSDHKLTSITLPDTITEIGSWAFGNCANLASINIPDKVTTIGSCAFAGCSSLTSITLPDGIEKISSDCFNGCSGLTSINIPNSVTCIDYNAFADCSKLTTLSIPNTVTTIERGAFRNVPLVIYDGTATNYSEWDAEKVVKSDGTVLYPW